MPGPQPKIREIDLLVPALEYLSRHAGGLATAAWRQYLEDLFQPSGVNVATVGPVGSSMTAFSQIARNAISNSGFGKNIIAQGFATYDATAKLTTITPKGLKLLADIGF